MAQASRLWGQVTSLGFMERLPAISRRMPLGNTKVQFVGVGGTRRWGSLMRKAMNLLDCAGVRAVSGFELSVDVRWSLFCQ